jgi:signal transduction histidine kinase
MKLRRLPLSASIALLVFLAELALLGFFAAGVYLLCEKQFLASFDESLRTNAMAIPAFVESQEGGVKLEMESLPDWGARFRRKKDPDLFAIVDTAGTLLVKFPASGDLPDWAERKEKRAVFGDFPRGARNYRGVFEPRVLGGEEEKDSQKRRVYVFYAADREEMDERLASVASALLWGAGLLLLVSGALAWGIAWRGLRPLHRLAGEAAAIRETTLDRRLSVRDIPVDLEPLAVSVNNLLERLEKAFERERQFSADAAHELRTPLSTLKSGIQAALVCRRDAAGDRTVLGELLEDVLRLEKLCESLLVIAAPNEKDPGRAMPLSDYRQCVAAVLEDFRPLAQLTDSSLTLSPGKDEPAKPGAGEDSGGSRQEKDSADRGSTPDPLVRADECSVLRIAGNLIENAILHGGTGVEVRVGIVEEERSVTLVVEDNGPGMPAEDQSRVFDRFFRRDQARARATGGAGLGLAICRALAERHGGSVRYVPRPEKGCRFEWVAEIAARRKAHSQGLKVEPGP